MSNKVIVFYTGELQELQESSLRQAHGIEHIIFVPIETAVDLETRLLESTERPFTVYNYMTDPNLVTALCDKLLNFTAETSYEPEYFIWVETTKTNQREETIKMSINKSRVIVITEASLAKSLNLQKEEINESIDVISLNISAISEEHVKKVFDDKVFRGYTKPTFVYIDDLHKYANVIASLVEGMNVYKNINVKILDMRDHTLMEILKDQANLEIHSRFEEMKAAQLGLLEMQYNKPDEPHVGDSSAPTNKQLIGRLKREPITRVMNPISFMVSGIVLSDDVMFGFEFEEGPNCFIYTSSEKNLLSWFNAFIMNLTLSKREFPMLKAVIYAFEDEHNQPMLGDDRDHQFVSRHIVAALELFGKTEGIKIFKPSEMEEFKQCTALTEEELEERKLLMAQAQQPKTLLVDVGGLAMPNSVKDAMQRLKSKLDEDRPDPYLSYGEAIEMCKNGIDVACVNWGADEFLTFNTGMTVPAEDLWSDGNKRAAMARSDQTLSVFPHTLRTNSYGTVPHIVDFNNQCSEWVVASARVKVKTAKVDTTDGLSKLVLKYALDTLSNAEFELAPFWIVYDVLGSLPQRVVVISENPKSMLPHIIGSMKGTHQQRHNITEESFQFDEDGIEGNDYSFDGVDFLCSIGLNDILKRIEAGEFKDVILDDDSFKTDFRLEKIKEALQRTNANWVTVSVKEQLFGITA